MARDNIIPLHRGTRLAAARPQGRETPRPVPAKPDLNALLARAGYRPTLRDKLEDFIFDVRLNPGLALLCAGGGMLVGLLAVIVPAVVIALVVA